MAEENDSAKKLIPARLSIRGLREASKSCKACDLWERGTQTVFGEGGAKAAIMFIGEQPGNEEDLSGKPFVGPAGRLLDEAMAESGIDRSTVYITNAVKHFKWLPRGKRRIHARPNAIELSACRPWLEAEIATVKPSIVVCLGATAAQALLGKGFRVTRQRGQFLSSELAPLVTATVHPSSILRAPDDETRRAEKRQFIDDLKKIAEALKNLPGR